jgi:site-specific DNA-methyltransferase (adenine-specific)
MEEPTKPMIAEAAKAQFLRAGNGRDYPRIQILTVEDLMTKGKRPEFFDMSLGGLAFKRAEKEMTVGEQQSLF